MRSTFKLDSRYALALLPLIFVGCGAPPGDSDDGTTSQAATVAEMRGVDSAGAFGTTVAKVLKNDFGVQWTGVYIGGPCSAGFGWSKSTVEAIHSATSWSFMPIYVGQQSSSICTVGHDLTTAQGEADGQHAAALMADYDWQANRSIPIVLDLEAGTYAADPGAAIDYVRGWVNTVKSLGYRAYVYSNPTGINGFAAAGLAIDAVWVASYFYNGFESLTPYDLTQIGSHFTNHNRAWQYAGAVDIPGIGSIDCNQSDLLLAPAPGGTNGPPPPPPKPCTLDSKSYPTNTCTETKQCNNGAWEARSSDPSSCKTGVEPGGACLTDTGSVDAQNTCTSTQECDDGVWVERSGDPSSCNPPPPKPCTLDSKSYPTNTCTETKQCNNGVWEARSNDPSNCRTGIEPSGACLTDSGSVDAQNTCTSTQQCDDGVWVERSSDPTSCR